MHNWIYAADCYRCRTLAAHSCLGVLSTPSTCEQCINGWTDRDAGSRADSCGTEEPYIRWGPDPDTGRNIFEGTCTCTDAFAIPWGARRRRCGLLPHSLDTCLYSDAWHDRGIAIPISWRNCPPCYWHVSKVK